MNHKQAFLTLVRCSYLFTCLHSAQTTAPSQEAGLTKILPTKSCWSHSLWLDSKPVFVMWQGCCRGLLLLLITSKGMPNQKVSQLNCELQWDDRRCDWLVRFQLASSRLEVWSDNNCESIQDYFCLKGVFLFSCFFFLPFIVAAVESTCASSVWITVI